MESTLELYSIIETLHRGSCEVSRAVAPNGDVVVIKQAARSADGTSVRLHIRHEAAILQNPGLRSAPCIGRFRALIDDETSLALVLEDVGGLSLAAWLRRRPFELREVLRIGADVAHALMWAHDAHVVHKDVNPSNIITNLETNVVQLIDFGLASRMSRQMTGREPTRLEGTWAYLAPEQTGRVGLAVDCRADLYGLGATLYELLTGQPPLGSGEAGFDEADALRRILVELPTAIREVSPNVPEIVATLVHKLLAKAPDERYQSAAGVREDLMACLNALQDDGGVPAIANFELGRHDCSDRLVLPAKLYGRQPQQNELRQHLAAARDGRPTLVMLGGPSGVGKSALAYDLQAELDTNDTCFVAGKFDELRRHVPYFAFGQAMEQLVLQISAGTDAQAWADHLRGAVGNLGGAIVPLAPSLSQLLGPQASLPALPPFETEARLSAALGRLIRAVCVRANLVLFIDDLQWADAGTVKLLDSLARTNDPLRLLVIAAYRNEALSVPSALHQLIQPAVAGDPGFAQLTLGPLTRDDIAHLIADVTGAPDVGGLADNVFAKTGGNSFFATQLLQLLWSRELLRFSSVYRRWQWDMTAIAALDVSDNIVSFVTTRLRELPATVGRLLQLASCLGDTFTAADVGGFAERSIGDVAQDLREAVAAGAVLPLDSGHFKFAHDRVRQACYESIDDQVLMGWHKLIGEQRARAYVDEPEGPWVFEALDHLNRCLPLITAPQDRRSLARLNIVGAKEARKAAVYDQSAVYLRHAEALSRELQDDTPHLTFELQVLLSDSEYLAGQYDAAITRLDNLAHASRQLGRQVELLVHRATVLLAASRMPEALSELLRALDELGLHLTPFPSTARVGVAYVRVRTRLALTRRESLLELPECTDARVIAMMDVLSTILEIAVARFDFNLFALVIFNMVGFTLRHGRSRSSALALWTMATVLVTAEGNLAGARALIPISRKALFVDDVLTLPRGIGGHVTFIGHLERSPAPLAEQTLQAFHAARQSGDYQYVLMIGAVTTQLALNLSVADGAKTIGWCLDLAIARNDDSMIAGFAAYRQEIACLRGTTHGPGTLSDAQYDEEHEAELARQRPAKLSLGSIGCSKLRAAVVRRDFAAARIALRWIDESGMTKLVGTGALSTVQIAIYAILTETQGKPEDLGSRAWRSRVRRWQRYIAWCSRNAPAIYGGFSPWAQAEIAAACGDRTRAMLQFETVVPLVEDSGYLVFAALVNESAGRLRLPGSSGVVGEAYMRRSLELYRRWGAHGKVLDMEEELVSALAPTRPESTRSGSVSALVSEQSEDVRTVAQAAQSISRDVQRDAVIRHVMSALLKVAGADRALLFLLDDSQLRLVAEQRGDVPLRLIERTDTVDVRWPERIVSFCVKGGDSVILNAGQAALWWDDPYFQDNKPKSVLCAPLLQQGKVRGGIYLENAVTPHVFKRGRLPMIDMLAAQAAISLENAALYENLEAIVTQRTRALHATQERLKRMENSAMQTQMAGGFAHEIRNALFSSSALLETLGSHKPFDLAAAALSRMHDAASKSLSAPAQAEFNADLGQVVQLLQDVGETLDAVGNSTSRALRVTAQILDYARLSQVTPEFVETEVRPVIDEIVGRLGDRLQHEHVGVTVEVDKGLNIPIKEDHLHSILTNLLANATDAVCESGPDRARAIRVNGHVVGDHVEVAVSDSGPGIAPHVMPRLFQPFVSTKGAAGTGLGLGMVKGLAELYGGSVSVQSQEHGATFTIVLPRS